MIQEIKPHIYDNQYTPVPPTPQDYVMFYEQGRILLREQAERIAYLTVAELEERQPEAVKALIYLFAEDDHHFYLTQEIAMERFPEYRMETLGFLRMARPKDLAFLGVTGHQLAVWYRSRRFCGHCGTPMKRDAKERMLFCEKCGQQEYPKISPAVIVGIRNGEKILMTKYAGRAYTNYALIAGFAEIGESIEDTVRREVMEEVGLKVQNITFYRSQPWSFSDTLLMGFFCDLDGDDRITLDREELAVGEWIDRDKIEDNGEHISLTKEMMLRFRDGLDRVPYTE
ncbi:MAG: NAD(+) diphosphatase [Eubacteriales bacterium]|nr:NAD(+) diphosphatase [Eubacteriales bacterium]